MNIDFVTYIPKNYNGVIIGCFHRNFILLIKEGVTSFLSLAQPRIVEIVKTRRWFFLFLQLEAYSRVVLVTLLITLCG